MNAIGHLLVFAVALAVLVKSADFLVEYAARLARRLRLSDLIVGLVITSIGTSLPELASSVSAAVAGSPGLVIGNVVGSNIANIGLVLGTAALVRPFATERRMHDRDGIILVASTVLFFVLVLDNRIGRLDALAFLAIYVAYVIFAARTDSEGIEHRFRDFLRFVFDFEYAAPLVDRLRRVRRASRDAGPRPITPPTDPSVPPSAEASPGSVWIEIAVVAASLAGLILSARFVVAEAIWLAGLLGLPENLIGLSLVAIGTSLPELLVAVTAARRGKPEMVVGNVMGSNVANVLLILGISGAIAPLEVAELSVVYTIPILLFFSLALLYFVRSDWQVGRSQGALALAGYVVFLLAAFVQGWG